jgi:hypothetical protein
MKSKHSLIQRAFLTGMCAAVLTATLIASTALFVAGTGYIADNPQNHLLALAAALSAVMGLAGIYAVYRGVRAALTALGEKPEDAHVHTEANGQHVSRRPTVSALD